MAPKSALLAPSVLVLVTACVSSVPSENSPAVEVGDIVQSGSLSVTIDEVYETGAALGSFETDDVYGQSYRSDPADLVDDPGSIAGDGTTTGDRTDFSITATSEDFDRVGTRYSLSINDGEEFAASQIKRDVDGPDMDLAAYGTTVSDIPTGTIVYGESSDNAAFLHIDNQTIEMAFTFTANLGEGTATLSADNGTHLIEGGEIAIDPETGIFYGTDAELGATGETVAGNVSGSLFGTEAAGVAGIVFSTDEAAPSVSANFVGSHQMP